MQLIFVITGDVILLLILFLCIGCLFFYGCCSILCDNSATPAHTSPLSDITNIENNDVITITNKDDVIIEETDNKDKELLLCPPNISSSANLEN